MLSIYPQGLLVAGDVGDEGVAGDAGEDGRRGAQGEATKLAVLDVEDEGGFGSPFGIGGGRYAAKLWQLTQALPEFFVFGQVCDRARLVLEVADEAAGKVLPTIEETAALRVEDKFEQVAFLPIQALFFRLEENDGGLVPGVQIPEPVERVGRVGCVAHKQGSQFAEVEQVASALLYVEVVAGKACVGFVEAVALIALQLQSARNALRDMLRRVGTHARLQVVDVGTREPRRLRQLSLR